ncbi:MAG: DUF4286 family protein [Gammaproteobacteria bacterium]|nr:DUF4286 family protein [Gammaproteobacteria bacterium]
MVIYEVNLTVKNEIFSDYYPWLIEHIKIMLQFQGFRKAQISKEKYDENINNETKLTVHYSLDTEADLEHYLNHHAKNMRAESISKFGDKFSASRRVLLQTDLIPGNDNLL